MKKFINIFVSFGLISTVLLSCTSCSFTATTTIEQPTFKATLAPTIQTSAFKSAPITTIQQPVLIITKVSEEQTIDFRVSNDWLQNNNVKRLIPEPGWKYVYVEFAVENNSSNIETVQLSRSVLNSSILTSADGFQYKNPVTFNYSGYGTREDISPTSTYFGTGGLNTLPSGFKALGVFNGSLDYKYVVPYPNTNAYTNRIAFRVGDKTSGYKLSIPGFAEIDLTKGAVSSASIKFPTDQPDSKFRNFGASVSVPNKGSITIEGPTDRTYQYNSISQKVTFYGTNVKVRLRFHNDSTGYGQNFQVAIKVFGDDGILYTWLNGQDGYIVQSGEVAPGQDKTIDTDIVTSSELKSGKLVVTGDINEIYNIQLPTAH